ncbi:hypothetical protein D2U88_13330 [Flagellimonas aequoris]|uniref:Uncharacterized protein n=1 Tax=Flagellimonas aequoris TaxID=2306997 RepID=A0A418N5G9_9FLAO|nr:hypothetical protein D2U88_13330 [Allomuricauda aequoris]
MIKSFKGLPFSFMDNSANRVKNSPLFFGHCFPNFKGRLFASYVRSTIKEGGSVKAFGLKSGGSAT